MTPFEILKIEPTRERRSIKRAYARELKSFNPDDDVQRFENLRLAYEHALLGVDDMDAFAYFSGQEPEVSPVENSESVELNDPEQETADTDDDLLATIDEHIFDIVGASSKAESLAEKVASPVFMDLRNRSFLEVGFINHFYSCEFMDPDLVVAVYDEFEWGDALSFANQYAPDLTEAASWVYQAVAAKAFVREAESDSKDPMLRSIAHALLTGEANGISAHRASGFVSEIVANFGPHGMDALDVPIEWDPTIDKSALASGAGGLGIGGAFLLAGLFRFATRDQMVGWAPFIIGAIMLLALFGGMYLLYYVFGRRNP